VLDAMQRIFPNHPFNLVLRDTVGSNAFTDGVYVFETNIATPTANFGWQVEFADIKRIFVTIRQLPGRDDACEVTVRAPLGRLGLNLILGGGFSTLGGGAGAAAGAAVAPGLVSLLGVAGILGAVVMGATAMVTGIASGGLVLGGYRALYRWGMRQGESALESLLQSLTVDVRTRGAFAPRSLRGETT
jgi:hypothetical protein